MFMFFLKSINNINKIKTGHEIYFQRKYHLSWIQLDPMLVGSSIGPRPAIFQESELTSYIDHSSRLVPNSIDRQSWPQSFLKEKAEIVTTRHYLGFSSDSANPLLSVLYKSSHWLLCKLSQLHSLDSHLYCFSCLSLLHIFHVLFPINLIH